LLAASTRSPLAAYPEAPGPSSSGSEPLAAAAVTCPPGRGDPFRLTERDRQLIELVFQCRALCDDHVQVALFSPGAASRCQRRLTLLYQHRYLDRLPRRAVNDRAVYLLTRRSLAGNRLMREQHGEEEFRRRLVRLGALQHLLAVNEFRVRVSRACRDLGWALGLWQSPEDLALSLAGARLVPDAYFQIRRRVDGQIKTAAFFLELERASKSREVLRTKLRRYGQLYYGGDYQARFGTRALRLLVVFDRDEGPRAADRLSLAADEARALGVTIARFTDLGQLRGLSPQEVLLRPLWQTPASNAPAALFSGSPEAE
jgi:Replication-relaxation